MQYMITDLAMDLVKTIEDDDEIAYQSSDDSGSDNDAQPTKKKIKTNAARSKDFDGAFEFADTQAEYMKDTWDDVARYVKKKARTTLDDKIAKVRKDMRSKKEARKETKDGDAEGAEEGTSEDDDDDDQENRAELEHELSDDELVRDDIRVKEGEMRRKMRKKQKEGDSGEKTKINIERDEEDKEDADFFEEAAPQSVEEASFYTMNLSRPLLKAIESMSFVHPTPIQAATIPLALAGRDICGCAATGTGKTAAYMLPVLERLLFRPKELAVTRVLVLVPTRELGVQVYQVTRQLTQFTSIEIGLSVGGLDLKEQESSLRKNPDVVIATPGRLIDHLQNTPTFGLESIEVLILDEADRILDESFLDQLKEIVKQCAQTRQTLLFSATMTDQVQDLATVSLKKPVKIFVDSNKVVAWNLRQEFVRLREAQEKNRDAVLASLVCRTFRDHTMVFIRTKKDCYRLHILLGLMGVRVGQLHGNMSQASRLHALKQFKEEEIDVLLTTDVAARGLDISGVKTVINYQLPYTVEQYIHRVGRTARAGRTGRSVSLADEEHRKMVREIIKNARNPVKNRVIPQPVVDKYVKKAARLQAEVQRVVSEEQAEREISALENKANRMENQLKSGEDANGLPERERTWFQNREKDKEQKKMTRKRAKKAAINFEDEDDKRAHGEYEYCAREAKRARKPKRMRTVHDPDLQGGGAQKGVKKRKAASAFENEITNVKGTNVKKMRHAASARQNELRRSGKKKGRGMSK